MITPKRPSGFHEFLPAEQIAFDKMIAIIRQSYERYGYSPLETPALELTSVLHAKEGGETAKQGYQFTKGDTDLALRFDLTVPLARYVAEHYNELALPFCRYQIQDVWRAEKPQAGRYRQFYQCDIDIIGNTGVAADANILIAMAGTMSALGLKSVIHLSNRKIFSGLLASRKLDKQAVEILRLLDKLDKAGTSKIKKSLLEIGLSEMNADFLLTVASWKENAGAIIDKLSALHIENSQFTEGLQELRETSILLAAAGVSADEYIVDLGIFRGFDYYTGMVFEITLRDNTEIGSVGSGGRYDNLVGHYSKEKLSGVGGSIGLSRLFAALKNKNTVSSSAQALIVVFNEKLLPYCFMVASQLRHSEINVAVYPSIDKASKQLNYANKLGIPFVLLCGEEEKRSKTVTVKHMASGEQKTMALTKVATFLKKL